MSRVARSILRFHTQLKTTYTRAAPPATSPNEWGTAADDEHSPTSDHAFRDFPGWGNDICTAGDFPNRPDLGLDAFAVLDAIRVSRDPRVKYAISNDRMFSSYTSSTGVPPYVWRPYNPTDPRRDKHLTHGHLSVVGDARADGEQPWQIGADDMDLNAIGGIVPGITNAQALKDIWVWAATARGLPTTDRFTSPTFQDAVLGALDDLKAPSMPDPATVAELVAAVAVLNTALDRAQALAAAAALALRVPE